MQLCTEECPLIYECALTKKLLWLCLHTTGLIPAHWVNRKLSKSWTWNLHSGAAFDTHTNNHQSTSIVEYTDFIDGTSH